MREGLFRGRRIDDGKWVYGYYVLDCRRNQHMIFFNKVSGAINAGSEPGQDDYDLEICEVDPETVGQDTGLKNINGVRIFGGDILYDDHWDSYGAVVYDGGGFRLNIDNLSEELYEFTDCDVIGNIHDNPELLEVE